MPTNTINLGLKTYNSTTDASATFVTYRSDQAGISPTSNMNLIDTWVGKANASLVNLSLLGIHYVRGIYISSNYYEATSTDISAYTTNMFISLSLSSNNDGTVGLNINGLGTIYLKRYNIDGSLIDFENAELKKNRGYIFRYDGTYWILVSSNIADQISVSGINQHLIMISPCGVLIDSGISTYDLEYISTSMIAFSTGSYVVLELNSDLHNEWLLTAGSNITLTQDASSSTVTINSTAISSSIISGSNLSAVVPITLGGTNANTESEARANLQVAPSSGSYVVLALNPELSNDWLLTAGSGISIIKDNSASTIAIKNNFFVDQSGSSVKTYGLISGSINGSNCDFTVSNQKFDSGTLLVYLNGQLQTQGSDDDWVETSASLGVFSFVTAPLVGDKIICHYMSKG